VALAKEKVVEMVVVVVETLARVMAAVVPTLEVVLKGARMVQGEVQLAVALA